jgi:hypothetical protein
MYALIAPVIAEYGGLAITVVGAFITAVRAVDAVKLLRDRRRGG